MGLHGASMKRPKNRTAWYKVTANTKAASTVIVYVKSGEPVPIARHPCRVATLRDGLGCAAPTVVHA